VSERSTKAKQFLDRILPAGGVEAAFGQPDALESLAESARLPTPERQLVRTTIDKLRLDQELTPSEQFAVEAIIIPDQRPAIDVVDGDFTVTHPLWRHLAAEPIKAALRKALPSVGRVEVSGIPGLPYGGTGFVVGPRLLMTNRHVAELFSSGLGRTGLSFRPGLRSAVDFKRERGRNVRQLLRVRRVVMIHPHWDMALLEVEGLADRNPPLTFSLETPEQLAGRDVAVIGYPAFDPRNPADVQNQVFGGVYYVKRLQPGKLGARRAVRSFDHAVSAMTHDASTLGGNSGSAVVDVASGRLVALHFAGAYLDANFTVPSWELSRDEHVVAAGVAFSGAVQTDAAATEDWWSALEAAEPDSRPVAPRTTAGAAISVSASDGSTITLPLQVTLRITAEARIADTAPTGEADGTEKMVIPVHDPDYAARQGYSRRFLGLDVPLPEPVDPDLCAPLEDGSGCELRYHHFSLVLHKHRRLALFSASNLDAHRKKKAPEPGRSYSRNALGGLGKNDMELWLADPRIAGEHQLPDRFFSKDKGAFDRGHVVRREDVAWGGTYQEVQFANGDTFHTTNCSPQVAGFNRPDASENWGDLEKYVSTQAGRDRLTLFAGPVLSPEDPIFLGVDDSGPVRIQIPQQYWKLVVAEEGGALQAFAFVLRQDLSDTPLEFAVDAAWRGHMVSVSALEDLLGLVRFPDVVRQADQADTEAGEAVRGLAGLELLQPAPADRHEPERPTPNSGDDSPAETAMTEATTGTTSPQSVPSWRVARSLLALRQQVNKRAPQRSKASDGTIGDAAHASRTSDHNPWVQDGATGVVTALDLTHDPAHGCDAGALAEAIRAGRDPRVKYVIWNRRIASSARGDGFEAWDWRPYGGPNPHSRHVHVSVVPEKPAYDSESVWRI